MHAVASRCAILALCVLPVAFHAEAQDATIAGTLVSDVGVNAPIAGKITLHRVGRGTCGWENPPPDKRVACRGTYTESTPDAYFVWSLPGTTAVAFRDSVLNYAPMDITANAGEDYTASSGSLTIKRGGYLSERAPIYFIDDSTDEHDETMAFQITVVRGRIMAQDFVAFQIADNDDEPSLSIGNDSVAEDSGTLAFEVSLDAASGKEITVKYTTADGTATSGADYASASGTLTFAAGDTAATIPVDVVDDGIAELDEDMTVTLSNAINAMIGTGLGTGTILDTTPLPGVSVSDERGPEDTVGELVFIVTLSAAGASEVTVSYATADDTATAGSDYTATNGTATFPVGTTAFTIDVPVLPDTVWEPNEDFILNLTTPANALIVDGTATGTIEDDEPQLAIADNEASEGDGSLPLVVTLGGTRGSLDVTVEYATSNLEAMAPDDYTQAMGTLTFAAGVSTLTIPVPLVDDSVDEMDETFSVELTNAMGAALADATATATIRDDDDPPNLSVADVTATEGSTAEFVASLDAASAQTVKVDFDTSSGTARKSDDFTAMADTLTFAPGARRATIFVELVDDTLDEPDETYTVALDSPVGAVIDRGTATGTITDNDDEPTVSVKDATGTEGGDADFVVELSAASGRDVTVFYATSDGTALVGSDFVAARDTLTITAGTTGGTIPVDLTDDLEDEENETFDLALTSPSNATILDGSATGTIEDNDDPPMLAVTDADGPEGGEAAFEVSLSATSGREVTVTYDAVDGTAIVGADFEAKAGTLTFPPGTRALPVPVTLKGDDIDEADETFELRLESPVHATLADDVGAGTIRDGDDPPTLAVTGADGPEGGEAAFEVSLSATSGREVTVTYDAVDGTAIVGADFEAKAGTLTFPPGTRALPVTVPLIDDDIDEADETFELRLESPVHATLADGVGAGTIRDGDDPPELSLAAARATEGTTAAFVATLTAASGFEVTVSYATTEGTAKAPDDFAATSGVLTFAPGTVRRMVSVAIADDALDEPEEIFELALSMPENATVSQGTATGTIVDNDDAPVVSVADAFAAEGGTLAFAVELSGASSRTVRVSFGTADGTAGAADYESVAGELTFATGTTRAMVSVQLLEDDLDEPEETFTLSLSAPVNASVGGTGTAQGRIVDNDGAPRLTVENTTATEGGHANFEVVLVGSTGQAVTVNYATRGLSAREGEDYEAAAGSLTLGMATSGDLVAIRTVPVALIDDTLAEPDETFELVLSSPANATLAAGVATGTIRDNDAAPTLSVTGATGEEGGDAVFTVILAGATSRMVTVRYSTFEGSADAGTDYQPAAGTLTFATGETTRTVAIALTDDAADEPDETFSLELQSPVNATVLTGTGTGTIRDNDATPSLSVVGGSGEEGSTVAFEVVLSGATDRAVAVDYATSDGTAHVGDDYEAAGGTLRFPPGFSVRTVTVRTHEDEVHEPNETFGLMLSSPINASLSSDAAIGRIVDDDGAPTLSIAGAAGTEGETVRFRVTLAGSGSESATVDYATVEGTASAGADYETARGTLTFAPGESVEEVPVRLLQDALGEPDESFGMRLSAAANATVTTADATATIYDDDGGIPMLSAGDAVAVEGGVLAFAFSLDWPAGSPVTVDYRTANGTALASSDYTAVSGTLTLDVGETSGSVEVPTLDDDVKELEENFSLHLSSAANAAPVATLVSDVVIGTILDNDVPPELAVEGGVTVEGEPAVFTVTLAGAVTRRVTVDFATVAGTALLDGDFLAVRGTLTFDAGIAVLVAVPTVDDDIDEPVETLGLSLTAPVNAELPVDSAISTIEDNDEPPALSIADASGGEGEVARFPVTLSDPSGFEVTVAYSTSDGTAVAGADYEAVGGSLAFAPGETTATISIPLIQDSLDEPEERFTVSLSAPANATLATATAEGSIIDDDDAVQLAVAGGTGVEGGTVEFAVTLDTSSSQTVTVDYATTGETADEDADYEPVHGTLTFLPGESAKTVKVTLVDDDVHEDDETFTLNLSMAENAAVSTASATGTIVDDDAAPELSITGGTAPEGGTISFTVTLTGSTSRTATVDYATTDGTAIADDDYEPVRGSLTFLPGESAKTVTVTLVDDDVHEDDETFALHLSMAENAAVSTASATGTIVDDDAAPELSIAGGTAPEGGTIAFAVTLTGPTSRTTTVDYATAEETADEDADYEPVHGTLAFLPGESAKTVTVTLVDDDVHEDDETFTLNLSMAENAAVSTASATGTIVDDDAAPELSIAGGTAPEGGTIAFAVTLTGSTSRTTTVDYATAEETADEDADYEPVHGTLAFLPGESAKTVAVTLVDDDVHEDDETFTLNLSMAENAAVSTASATGTIVDDDAAPELSIAGGTAPEGGTIAFTVTLTGPTSRTTTVDYATAGETADEDADYEPVHGTLAFLPGESAKTVAVTLVDDDVHEDDETFTLNLSMAENAAVSTASATGTIVDDDAAPELSIAGGTAPEGGTIAFTVTLTGPTSRTTTVDYATAGETADEDADYEPVHGTLAFLPGESAKTVAVTLVDDDVHEDDETFTLNLSMAENAAVSTASATGTIVDDDAAPELSIAGGTAPEGGTIAFTVTLTGPTSRTTTVDYATAGETADEDADYEPVHGTLAFLPGESAKTVAVTLVDDDVHEDDETFTLNLSMAENAAVSTASATGTIVDDDAAPELAIAGGTAPEGGTIAFTVTLTGPTSRTTTVDYATAGETADEDADYEPVHGTLAFLPGESAKTVAVTLVDDDVHEDDETFTLNLSMAENAAVSTASATGTIVDDDAAPELSIAGGTAPEGGTIAFTVTLTGPTSRTTTVDYATAGETADEDADYEPVHGTLAFLPGESAKTVAVTLVDDDVHEDDETFTLNLSMAENAAVSTASATGTIVDDDAAPELAIAGGTAPEGGTIAFTVTLTGPTSRTTTVDYATAGETADEDADYEPVHGTLAFLPGESAKTVAVTLVDDDVHEDDETFTLNLSMAENAAVSTASATGTIVDDDAAPELSITGGTAPEGGTIAFTVTLTGSTSRTTTVDYATAGETADEDADYEPVHGTLTFLPGESAKTVAVTLVDDDVHEDDETFTLNLSMAENAAVSTASATGTIVDDDAAPELAIAGGTAPEGGTIAFTVTLTGSTSRTTTVDYATAEETADEDADYEPVHGTLAFLPGESAKTVAVTLVDDDVHEDDETFTLNLSMAENAAVSTASATGTIVDDDAAPELAIAGGTAPEGGTIAFTVTLTGSTSRPTTVDYATADGTAITGDDYAPTSGTLTFVPGDTVATIAVSIADDEEYEPEESFEAVLSSPVHATLATRAATGTILDDDEKPATPFARPADPMLCVGGDPVEIDLARHFDGTSLRYSAASADTAVATVELRGSVLSVAPVEEGQTTLVLSAANGSGEASIELTATVVTDPAELAAIEGAFARAWSGLLAEIMGGIGDRFANAGATASTARPAVPATRARPDGGAFAGGGTTRGWDRSTAFGGGTTALQMPGAGPDTTARPRSGAFSLSTGAEGGSGDWSVWGRGSVRRHESLGVLDLDGSLETLQIGADRRISDWILGASAAVSRADTNFRFVRSADVCGGDGTGEGVLETELASVHPYAGRKVGGGWVWATLGFGRGEAVLKRCVSGRRTTADVSVRMGALGARHRVGTGGRLELSLVEDIGVLRATTGAAVGPVADLSASVGRARIGVEVGTVPGHRPVTIVAWARTLARHDWGDGIEGTGLEVAAGARLRIPCRRFGLDVSAHVLAVHSADDHEERGADIAASILPRDDGSGVQLTLALRRGARSDLDRGAGDWLHDPRWPRSDVGWRRDAYLGYGIVVRRALVQPFASIGTANGDRRSQRVGLRIDSSDGQRRLGTEISVGREERWPDAGGFVLIRFDARI